MKLPLLLLSAVAGTALAQDSAGDPDGMLETVTVTARKFEENWKDVPFGLSVIDGGTLDAGRIDRSDGVARLAPNVGTVDYNEPRSSFMTIRGVGSLSAIGPDDASVTTYIDGVPLSSMSANRHLLDVERVEILRGPQGTLFGRNTSAGAVNVVFRRPDGSREIEAIGEAGSDAWRRAEARVGGRLGDADGGIPFRLAVRHVSQDGFVDNLFDDRPFGRQDATAFRFAAAGRPDAATRADFTFSGETAHHEPAFAVAGIAGYPRVALEENRMRRRLGNLGLTVERDLGWSVFTSTTGYGATRVDNFNDTTEGVALSAALGGLLPAAMFAGDNAFNDWRERDALFSQEFRLASPASAATRWIAGVSLVDQRTKIDYATSTSTLLGGGVSRHYRRHNDMATTALAAFGEGSLSLGGGFTLTAGLRASRERKTYDADYAGDVAPGVGSVAAFAQRSRLSDGYLTGRAALSYAWNERVSSHATVARGYKPGGYPLFSYNAANGVAEKPFDPARSRSVELGTRAELLGGRLRLGGTLFHNDVADEHVISTVAAGSVANPFLMYVPENLDVRTRGVELEATWRIDRHLALSGSYGYTRATIRGVPAASTSGAAVGNTVPNVPTHTAGLAVDWRYPLTARLGMNGRLSWQHVSSRQADTANGFSLPSADLVDARIGLSVADVDIYLFGSNLLDETGGLGGVSLGAGIEAVWPRRGRTVGIGVVLPLR